MRRESENFHRKQRVLLWWGWKEFVSTQNRRKKRLENGGARQGAVALHSRPNTANGGYWLGRKWLPQLRCGLVPAIQRRSQIMKHWELARRKERSRARERKRERERERERERLCEGDREWRMKKRANGGEPCWRHCWRKWCTLGKGDSGECVMPWFLFSIILLVRVIYYLWNNETLRTTFLKMQLICTFHFLVGHTVRKHY